MLHHRDQAYSARPRQRKLGGFQRLEERMMLSGTPPQVTNVAVSSTAWAPAFVSYLQSSGLGTGGYAIPVGSANQLKTLPWSNVDQIKISFNENVVVNQNALDLTGVNVTQYAFSNFNYDASTFTATWTLSAPIAKDRLLIDLNGDGLSPVHDASNLALDGEWVDGTSTLPSGNGVAGGDFQFRLNVLPGDVNQSGGVFGNDVLAVQNAQFKVPGNPGYSVFLDVNGSASILGNDVLIVQNRQFSTLPSGQPAGLTNDAPSAGQIPNVVVSQNAVDQVISLNDFFTDDETPVNALTYQIVQDTNSQLFTSTAIDPATGHLTLGFATNTWGSATLTVRATDAGGLHVDTSFAVTVDNAPQITNFTGEVGIDYIWTFTGNVVDETPGGLIITFGGILTGQSVVTAADGSFSYTVQLDPNDYGDVTAQTTDPQGRVSNVASYMVFLT